MFHKTNTKKVNAKNFLTGTHNCTFQFKKIQDISILRIINDLPNKSSTGFDDISMRLIKAIKTEIIPALTCIFNQSSNMFLIIKLILICIVYPLVYLKGLYWALLYLSYILMIYAMPVNCLRWLFRLIILLYTPHWVFLVIIFPKIKI